MSSCLQQLFLLVVMVQVSSATYQASCSTASDCSIANEQCLSLSPLGCTKGYCMCKSGMDYSSGRTACQTKVSISIGGACTGADFEKHVSNSGCYNSVSTCYDGYSKSGSSCAYNYGKSCSSLTDCGGSSTALNCTGGTCQCLTSYKYSGGTCVFKASGDSCSYDSDCWPLGTTSAGVGYSCNSGVCGCQSGYTAQSVTDIDINEDSGTLKTVTATFCFSSSAGNTYSLGSLQSCTIWPYSSSISPAKVCGSSYGCYSCPEDTTTTNGTGLCRPPSGSSSSSSTSGNSTNSKSHAASTIWQSKSTICDFAVVFVSAICVMIGLVPQ